MKKLIAILFISVLTAGFAGCQTQEQKQTQLNTKQARIIAANNIKLKKQLALKDKEIQAQKDLLAECKKENENLRQSSSKAGVGFMEMYSASAKQIEILKAENEALKARIKELENK